MSDAQIPSPPPSPAPVPSSSKEKIFTNIEAVLAGFLLPLILVIVILLGLNYFNILPVSRVFPFLSFLPTKDTGKTPPSGQRGYFDPQREAIISLTPIPQENVGKEISVASDTKHKVSLVNKDEFISRLTEMGIYGRVYAIKAGDNTPADTINIRLTDIEQPEHKLLREDVGTLYSSKTTFSENVINILVYVSPNLLSDTNLSPEQKGAILQEAVIVALYSYAHATEPAEDIRNRSAAILQDMGKNNKVYLRIE
jgi:hypothetical protein